MRRLAVWTAIGLLALSSGSQAAMSSPLTLSDKSSLSDLVASLTSAPRPDLSRVRSDSQVTFIRVSVMPGYSKDKMRLSPAARQAMVGTEAAVSLNAALLGRLIDAGYSTTDVIAVSVDPKGGVTVFVNK